MRTTRILTVIIDGHYTTINSTRTGYHKVKGYAKNTDVDHATIKQDERHYTTVILMGLSIMQWSNGTKMSHYTTINLMRTWDGTRRSIMLRIGRQGFTQQLTWWGWGILWGEVTCEVEWTKFDKSPLCNNKLDKNKRHGALITISIETQLTPHPVVGKSDEWSTWVALNERMYASIFACIRMKVNTH